MATWYETEQGRLPHDRWTCRWKCGFFRDFSTDLNQANTIIDHPVWGVVTNYQAAELDIEHHSCWEYRRAIQRCRSRQQFATTIRSHIARRNHHNDQA